MTDISNNSEHDDHSDHTGTPELSVEPVMGAAPKVVADELFSHGLLTYLHTDTPARQGERIGRVMGAIEGEQKNMGGTPVPQSLRFPIRTARGWLALAACLTIGTVAVFIGVPGEQSAQAVVQQSIDAMRSTAGGDRRYEIRIQRPTDDALPSLPGAIIDTRSPNLLLLRSNAPDGHEIIAGRDATGGWCIRRDGGIEREHPEQAWPKWSKVGEESLLVDSVDRLLEELTKSYDLQREGTATLEGKPGVSYRHIVGTKKRVRSPGGDRVEVWIDPESKAVERVEMKWDQPPAPPQPSQGRGAAGEEKNPDAGGEPKDDGDGRGEGARPERDPMGPMGGRPPRREGPDGMRPEGMRPDGVRPDGAGARGPRPEDDGPMGGPMGGPMDGPGGPGPEGRRPRGGHELDGPRPRPEPRPDGQLPPRDGGRREGGPEGLRAGPGPGSGMGPGMGRGPGMFGPGPRGPGPGARPNPPRMLVMQRVDAPAFDGAWFGPEVHVGKE